MAASPVSSMTSSSLAAVLLCAAAVAFFSGADAKTTSAEVDLVTKTCVDIMRHDWEWLSDNEKFCESRLRTDKKRSAAAKHPRDLALIAMDLAQRAVADADAKVAAVLRSGAGRRSKDTALTLRHCRLDYASAASAIPVCRAMVEGYNKQQLVPNDYFDCAHRLRIDTTQCWFRIIVTPDVEKLLLKEVDEARKRIELVGAMLEEMLGIVVNDHEPPRWI
ncbi:unnamed protein product [Urochloa decumbens]|uniref:Pectinesterase inhibitor domain-containing protein n=1 Tax=Urochloa decumbens TaxID=240449 RepID=A0ABC9DVD9_9POAL